MTKVARPYDHLHDFLNKIISDRDLLPIQDVTSPYWHDYELLVMWREVNLMRRDLGKKPIAYHRVDSAEQQASGHFDYVKNFALNCANLVNQD